MKQLMFFLVLFFGAVSMLQGQHRAPVTCSSCEYGYQLIGQRKLVGESRNYYGSEKRQTSAPYSAKPTSADRELLLGDVYPAMGNKNLFRNYSPDGVAHLTELGADTKVFKRNGYVYAYACENLLELVITLTPAPPVKKEEVGTLTIVRDTIRYEVAIFDTVVYRTTVVEDNYVPDYRPDPYYAPPQVVVSGGYVARASYTLGGGWCPPPQPFFQQSYCPPQQVVQRGCSRCGQQHCGGCRERVQPRGCSRCGQQRCGGCRPRQQVQQYQQRSPQGTYASNGSHYGPRTGGGRTEAPRRGRR